MTAACDNHASDRASTGAPGAEAQPATQQPPWRRLLAELVGTALLATVVVGSGIMAADLSADAGVQLLANSTATALALPVLILVLGPVSGAHLNPAVSLADWFLGRRTGTGLTGPVLAGYLLVQTSGAITGAILANLMFDLPAVELSRTDRAGVHLWLGETVATAGLILLIFALARAGRAAWTPAAVGAYIGAAYWFTSSTSFANPALTLGRAFTDTFAGIAPGSVPGFIGAQLAGIAIGAGLLLALYPFTGRLTSEAISAGAGPATASHLHRDRFKPPTGSGHEGVPRQP